MQIIINNTEFIEEQAAKQILINMLESIVNQLTNLDLTSLDSIIIPDNFGKELIAFQEAHNLRSGYTNTEHATAFGKVLTYIEDNRFKTTIFLDPRVAFTLFDDEKRQNSVHIIHHELCHVHDDFIKYNTFHVTDLESIFLNTNDKVSQVTFAFADMIWSEYFATKLSARSKPDEHDMYVDSLMKAIPLTEKECRDEIQKYHLIHVDVPRLFMEIQLKTSYLLKTLAYVLGYAHAFNTELPDDFKEHINNDYPYLSGVWNEISDNLKQMHKSYGAWESVEVFKPIADRVLELWRNIGIIPSNTEDGQLYITVASI